MIQAAPYQVERLDWVGRKAFVTRTHVDYYTDAIDYTRLKVLECFDGAPPASGQPRTTARCMWSGASPATRRSATTPTRTSATARSTCPTRRCTPRAVWWQLTQPRSNGRSDSRQAALDGFLGAAYALHVVATVAVMADARDLQKAVGSGDGAWFAVADSRGRGQLRGDDGSLSTPRDGCRCFTPTVFLYDNFPGGIGLSEPLWRRQSELLGKGARTGGGLRLQRRLSCLRGADPGRRREQCRIAQTPGRARAGPPGEPMSSSRHATELAQETGGSHDRAGKVDPCARAVRFPRSLRKLLGIRSRLQARVVAPDRELPAVEIAPGLLLVEALIAWPEAPSTVNADFAKFGTIPSGQLLHFDTETTGLSGGSGTRAFMIGASDWHEGRLRIRQLYLKTMAAEQSMLEAFASWLPPDTTLVSYNGRCYDSPLLATRYRWRAWPIPSPACAISTCLFPVRRRFRGVWENCRLATVERQWLDVIREDDLPGSEAPRAWLDYLRGGSARNLRRVIEHNDQDLRSLGALLLRLARTEDLVLETSRAR